MNFMIMNFYPSENILIINNWQLIYSELNKPFCIKQSDQWM